MAEELQELTKEVEPAPAQQYPLCPYCEVELAKISNSMGILNGLITSQTWCHGCRKLLSFQILAPAPQAEQAIVSPYAEAKPFNLV